MDVGILQAEYRHGLGGHVEVDKVLGLDVQLLYECRRDDEGVDNQVFAGVDLNDVFRYMERHGSAFKGIFLEVHLDFCLPADAEDGGKGIHPARMLEQCVIKPQVGRQQYV